MSYLDTYNSHYCRIFNENRRLNYVLESIDIEWKCELRKTLQQFYYNNLITANEKENIKILFDEVSGFMKDNFSKTIVYVYGSHASGLATKDSDLDITVLFHDGKYFIHLPKGGQKLKLDIMYSYFSKINKYLKLVLISKARIPIIKFQSFDGFDVDVSIDNFQAIESTELLRTYSDLSPYFVVLAQLLKNVVKFYRIGEAYEGTLSSYGYMLMLIHFLQQKGILPVLHEKNENYEIEPNYNENQNFYILNKTEINNLWKDLTLVDLWIGFFKYYTLEFNTEDNVVSIRHSQPVFKSEKRWWSHLAIENPLDGTSNIGSHLNQTNFNKIFYSFRNILLVKGDINKIFQNRG